jgi:hypothetical protein
MVDCISSQTSTRLEQVFQSACTTCFSRYCWNGTTNSTTPSGNYAPRYNIGEVAMVSSYSAAIAKAGSFVFVSGGRRVRILVYLNYRCVVT